MSSSIQLLRSNNLKERPFPGNLLDGQPAINTNAEEPGFFFKTSEGSIVKIGPAYISYDGLPPNFTPSGQVGNSAGEIWIDASFTPPIFKVYDGTAWIAVEGAFVPDGSVTEQKLADLSVSAQKIQNGSITLEKLDPGIKLGDAVNVLDFGATGNGTTNDAAAIQAAVNSLPLGGAIYFPAGTYRIATSVNLNSNLTLFGDGSSSILLGPGGSDPEGRGSMFYVVEKSNICLRDLNFFTRGVRGVAFRNCDFISMLDCFGDGNVPSTGNVTGQGFWFGGCRDVLIENPTFKDFRDCVYLSPFLWPWAGQPGNFPCGRVTVRGGMIWQENHGTTHSYPTGVYNYVVEDLVVEGTTFKNIKPSPGSDPGAVGYGVYEGDGPLFGILKSNLISNCTFVDDDGYVEQDGMTGILTSAADTTLIVGCQFLGPGNFKGFRTGTKDTRIDSCFFKGSHCSFGATTGVPSGSYKSIICSNCTFIDSTYARAALAFGDSEASAADQAVAIGNYFRNCNGAGILMRFVTYGVVMNNTFIDCNTGGLAEDFRNSGVCFFGCIQGLVDGNTVINITTGQAKYGLSSASITHAINFTANNRISNMVNGSVQRPLSTAPSFGTWSRGEKIHFWNASAGSAEGVVCVTAGTPGVWKTYGSISP